MNFRVDLETYRGPLDLLLYLVRKHELDILDIPIAEVTRQYVAHLEVLQVLDVDAVGDFLEMASTLVEIKSRLALPRVQEDDEPLEDPRDELVQQLLEYKQYKDAASMLDERSRQWQRRYERLADDLPTRRIDPAEQPIHEIELWDLVSAFGRIMRDSRMLEPSNIVFDETPIHVYMQHIHERLVAQRRLAFSDMFQQGMHKSALIGIFLAILELVRHHSVRTEQVNPLGEIWVIPGDRFRVDTDWSQVTEFAERRPVESDMPSRPR